MARRFAEQSTPVSKDQAAQEVHAKDLPLSCPTADATLWNAHPRVFLPIEETGEAECPYCGACFVLKPA